MGDAPKRFIKKVPPSGAAPVFKLTLPHRVVHAHLSHLIDAEFEIATSPASTHSWQGTIAPRRNKDRSEYTLQGWRLFAEAHGVQPGDQVAFELVSPHRLVVQVISTEDTKLTARTSHEGTSGQLQDEGDSPRAPSASEGAGVRDLAEQPGWPGAALAAAAAAAQQSFHNGFHEDTGQDFRQPRPAGSGQSSSQHDAEKNKETAGPSGGTALSPTTPRAGHHGSLIFQMQPASGAFLDRRLSSGLEAAGRHASRANSCSLPPKPSGVSSLFRPTPQQGGRPQSLLQSGLGVSSTSRQMDDVKNSQPHIPATVSNSQLDFQLRNLTQTIHSLQSEMQQFENRARQAEFEAAQMKLHVGEIQGSLDNQSRAVMLTCETLEELASKLAAPALLSVADQSFAERVKSLQTEMYICLNRIKESLHYLSTIQI